MRSGATFKHGRRGNVSLALPIRRDREDVPSLAGIIGAVLVLPVAAVARDLLHLLFGESVEQDVAIEEMPVADMVASGRISEVT